MLQTDKTKVFYLLPPPFSDFDFIASRKAHLLHFLKLFDGSPYLVLLGGRLTALGHSLEKYESSAILNAGRQHEKLITDLIAYRQPPPPKQRKNPNSKFSLQELSKSQENKKPSNKIPSFLKISQNFFDGGISQISKERKKLLFNDQATQQKELDAVYQNIPKVSNKMLVSKITNPGRVHLARKLNI